MTHIFKSALLLFVTYMPLISIAANPECVTQAIKCIAEIKDSETSDFPIVDFIDAEIIGELEHRSPFKKLVVITRANWKILLDHFAELAPDRKSRTYLLHAILYLPPDEYMKALSQIFELRKSGKIGKDEFQYIILMPPHVPKDENPEYFLPYNYQHPDVVKFLNDVQKHYKTQDDNSLDVLIQHLLSGESKSSSDNIRKDAKDTSKLPILSSPNTTENKDK